MKRVARLDLNFGRGVVSPRRAGVGLLAVGAMAATLAFAQAGMAYRDWQLARERHEQVRAQARLARGADHIAPVITSAQKTSLSNAARIATQLRTPWQQLFLTRESVPTENVALLSVEPIGSARQLRLSAEAKNLDAMVAYVDFLQQQPVLRGVVLVSHHMQRQAPGMPVRFQLQAQWGGQ